MGTLTTSVTGPTVAPASPSSHTAQQPAMPSRFPALPQSNHMLKFVKPSLSATEADAAGTALAMAMTGTAQAPACSATRRLILGADGPSNSIESCTSAGFNAAPLMGIRLAKPRGVTRGSVCYPPKVLRRCGVEPLGATVLLAKLVGGARIGRFGHAGGEPKVAGCDATWRT